MNTSINNIRLSIANNVAQSHEIRRQIHATKGKERDANWNAKRRLGADTRILLLALGYLRGRPYARMEKPRESNAPNTYDLACAIDGGTPTHETQVRLPEWLKGAFTPARVASAPVAARAAEMVAA